MRRATLARASWSEGSTNPMGGRIPPRLPEGQAFIRAVGRPIVFSDSTDLDIDEWLGDHPDVTSISGAPNGSIEEIFSLRIADRVGRSVRLSSPPSQQVLFEIPSQNPGLGAILVTAVMVKLYMRRIPQPALARPSHSEPGGFRECEAAEALQIAALSHRWVAGRIDGRTMSGANFAYQFALTFGTRVDNDPPFSALQDNRQDGRTNAHIGRSRGNGHSPFPRSAREPPELSIAVAIGPPRSMSPHGLSIRGRYPNGIGRPFQRGRNSQSRGRRAKYN